MKRSIVARALLVVVSTLVSFALAELVLRVLDIAPDRTRATVHLETADKRHGVDLYPDDPRDYFQLDLRDDAARAALVRVGLVEVESHFERTPFAVPGVYSAELCRGSDIAPRDPARRRVLFVGDSFTEGQGVREDDTFVARLRARAPADEWINCGRRGYDFPRLREWLDERIALAPDVVVYAMVLNDPRQSDAFHARQTYLDDWILARRRMFTEGDGRPPPWEPRLSVMVRDRIESARVGEATTAWYRGMVGAENAEGWTATLDDIAAMRATSEAHGARFVVALWPLMIDLEGTYPFEDVHRTITDALTARGIEIHDMLPAFRGRTTRELWVHPADHHPNERAHAIFADALSATLAAP